MSHTTTLNGLAIKDVQAMRTTIAELQGKGININLLENTKPRMYFGNQHGECAFVLSLPDSKYDVGLDRQEDGSFIPVFDEYQGHVGNQLGADQSVCPMPRDSEDRALHAIGQFSQGYAKNAAINAAAAQGYSVTDTSVDDEGNVHLILEGM
jgi:hypothetical protein